MVVQAFSAVFRHILVECCKNTTLSERFGGAGTGLAMSYYVQRIQTPPTPPPSFSDNGTV